MPSALVTVDCALPAAAATERLAALIEAAGMTVFATVDHGANAVQAGLPLRPTVLLVFGNAARGTPLMQERQTVGFDLPLKMLVWEDDSGRTRLSYESPQALMDRHGLPATARPILDGMASALARLASAAAAA